MGGPLRWALQSEAFSGFCCHLPSRNHPAGHLITIPESAEGSFGPLLRGLFESRFAVRRNLKMPKPPFAIFAGKFWFERKWQQRMFESIFPVLQHLKAVNHQLLFLHPWWIDGNSLRLTCFRRYLAWLSAPLADMAFQFGQLRLAGEARRWNDKTRKNARHCRSLRLIFNILHSFCSDSRSF